MSYDIETTLAKYIAEKILRQPKRAIAPGDKLISSGLIDSLSMVSLKMFLDQTYCVRIPDAEARAEAFDSASALVTLLRRLGVK